MALESKVMRVFYGADGLPYKDSERTVHYPIFGGKVFQGSSQVDEIRFYYQEIGTDESVYVAVSKLPNGRAGSELLEKCSDDELGEKYAKLVLKSFYLQYKGDVYISLQAYEGEMHVTTDPETGITTIDNGQQPTLRATGSIVLNVAYAPQFVGSGEEQNVTLQDIFDYISGQSETYVQKTSDAFKVYGTGTTGGQITITWSQSNQANSIARRKADGNIAVAETPVNNEDATSKKYVQDNFVGKTASAKQLYGTDVNGEQTTYTITTAIMTGQVPQRDENGDVLVPTTPTSNSAAVSKSYVDTNFLKEGYSGYHELNYSEISEDLSDNLLIENLGNNIEINAYNGEVLIQQRNVIQELDQLKAEFYEAVVEIKDYEIQGLYSYPIPSSISGQVTLYSAGLDVVYLYGASVVMSQRINATGASGDYGISATCNGTHVTLSGTSTYSGGDRNLYLNTSPVSVISGHKYLVFSTSNEWCLFAYGSGQSSSASAGQEIFTASVSKNVAFSIFPLSDSVITNGNVINAQFDVYFIDLTLMYGCNANIPASLLSTPADFFKLYNGSLAYSTPTIRSSCPTKIDTVGLNQWDEEFEVVGNHIESKNYCPCIPNTTYYYYNGSGVGLGYGLSWYDKDKNLIKTVYIESGNATTSPVNAFFFKFGVNDSYGTTYRYDICINVSNASFNGNYAPYTKDERTLQNPPILKGIRNSCNDDTTYRRTNIVNLASLSWTYDSNNKQFYSDEIDDALDNINSGFVPVLCSAYAYNSDGYNVDSTPHVRGIIGKRLYIVDETLNGDASFIKGGAVYQLATPVRQTYVELPKDMKISAGGTINVTYGDTNNDAPLYSIYTQIATVK